MTLMSTKTYGDPSGTEREVSEKPMTTTRSKDIIIIIIIIIALEWNPNSYMW